MVTHRSIGSIPNCGFAGPAGPTSWPVHGATVEEYIEAIRKWVSGEDPNEDHMWTVLRSVPQS